jgi:TM2 domain-containing membrane protein YozV
LKTKGTAIILALFLGGIGVHKFYLGQSFQGLLYLLFCWTFIPACIAFLEIFVYAFMSDTEFDRRYNQMQPAMLPAPSQNQMGQNVTINMQNDNVADELHKLNDLRMSGAITDEEFVRQKQRLLS